MNASTQPEAVALADQSARELKGILARNAEALADQRSDAAARILASMKRLKPSADARSGKELLQQVRYGRHGL